MLLCRHQRHLRAVNRRSGASLWYRVTWDGHTSRKIVTNTTTVVLSTRYSQSSPVVSMQYCMAKFGYSGNTLRWCLAYILNANRDRNCRFLSKHLVPEIAVRALQPSLWRRNRVPNCRLTTSADVFGSVGSSNPTVRLIRKILPTGRVSNALVANRPSFRRFDSSPELPLTAV